jgi:hypothetical protein
VDSKVTCDRIQEQLEALAAGALPDEEFLELMGHIDRCPDCAMLLRLQQHTAAGTDEELQAIVPDHLADGMYGRVMEEIGRKAAKRPGFSLQWPSFRWLVPALSTAVVVLLVGGGMMFHEIRELKERENALSNRVMQQERLVRDGGPAPASSVGLRDRLVLSSGSWARVLARQEETSIAELQSLLERLPPETQILDTDKTVALMARYGQWMEKNWNGDASGIDPRDGLQAGEMVLLIRVLDPDPETRIPTARLISLSQSTASRTRLLGELRGL